MLAAGLCAWGLFHGRRTPYFDPVLGKNVVGWTAGDPMWPGWPSYRRFAYQIIVSFPLGRALMDRYDLSSMSVFAVVMFVPQFVFALAGGLLAMFIVWVPRMFRFRPGPSRRSLFRGDH
jgi:hypothetical protein